MTIKHRHFFSSIYMVLISFIIFLFVAYVMMVLMYEPNLPSMSEIALYRGVGRDILMVRWVLIIAIFLLLASLINGFLSFRMTRRIIQEVTLRQKKDEANRRELIAGISHDLCTPLTSIISCIEGIETGVASTQEMQKKYHTYIKNEADNMKHIIEQLFLFSKLDMEEFPLNLICVDIALTISEMIEDSLSRYESCGLSIDLKKMPENLFVSVDVRLIRNVINNILENSVNYKTKIQGKMEISATVENSYILLRFEDDGPGVEEDMLPKLSDVFYRADPSRTDPGSGLGLAISAKIIHNMNGQIHAELPSSGGLAIVIKLPLLKELPNNGR